MEYRPEKVEDHFLNHRMYSILYLTNREGPGNSVEVLRQVKYVKKKKQSAYCESHHHNERRPPNT